MSKIKPFKFEGARRITPDEVKSARKAIEAKLGIKRMPRRGRPPKPPEDRAQPVSIRLSPEVVTWAKAQAAKRGVGYQTFLNETLRRLAR